MGGFKDMNFVTEMSYRTMLNYYNVLMLSGKSNDEEIQLKIDQTKQEMAEKGYLIDDFFEVTQLINSLIGLLVFPEQAFFHDTRITRFSDELKTLNFYVSRGNDYYYSNYKYLTSRNRKEQHWSRLPNERSAPINIIRHLRNAVSHSHLMIRPVWNELNTDRNITSVVFEDICAYEYNGHIWLPVTSPYFPSYPHNKCESIKDIQKAYDNSRYPNRAYGHFYLKIDVDDLEPFFFEICRFMTNGQ